MNKPLHFALVGENMYYSQMPRIFEAISKHTGQIGQYDLHSVNRTQLGECVNSLVSEGVSGFSVTIPHKQAVIEYLDEISPIAKSLMAVNSVAIKNGRLFGYNTDSYGVTYTFKRASISLNEGPVLIFGSGGAARAVIYALCHDFGIKQFTVCNRSNAGLRTFKQEMSQAMVSIEITTVIDTDDQDEKTGASPTIVITSDEFLPYRNRTASR